jgi:scavenger receptor class B, member 1
MNFRREYLVNINATFHDNGTLSFVPSRRCVFLPERSVGDPTKDIVTIPNLVLLAASTASAKLNSFAALGVSTLVKSLNAQPLINLTVSDFMWGYDDNLVKLANNLVPNIITFDRLGVLDRVSKFLDL